MPNIGASVPQLKAAIAELQAKGYNLPNYPDEPQNEEEHNIKVQYAKVLGSAVNPVLREGNSDRRVAQAVKNYAKKNPHSMGAWTKDSKSHVASMHEGDFYANEKSVVIKQNGFVKIVLENEKGQQIALKEQVNLIEDEVIDASVMSHKALREYFKTQIEDAKANDTLLSLHFKATMMKVSDPIMFGHAVSVYYKDLFDKHADLFEELGINPNNGIGEVYSKIESLDSTLKNEIISDIENIYENNCKPSHGKF